MHRALSLCEIQKQIFIWLQLDNSYKQSALAALAVTCRTLSEPALDLLWRSPNVCALSSLVRIMPPQSFKISSDYVQDYYSLAEKHVMMREDFPFVGDWIGDRFKLYSHRIRIFQYHISTSLPGTSRLAIRNHTTNFIIDDSVFAAWNLYGTGILFPHIESIDVDIEERNPSNYTAFLAGLITSSLVNLRLSIPADSDEGALSILEKVKTLRLDIRNLDIIHKKSGVKHFSERVLTEVDIISSLGSLHTFRSDAPLRDGTLHNLAALPALSEAYFLASLNPNFTWSSTTAAFSALTNLHITCSHDDTSFLSNLISAVRSTKLTTLHCSFTAHPHTDVLRDFLMVLADSSVGTSILDLKFSISLKLAKAPVMMPMSPNQFLHITNPLWRTTIRCLDFTLFLLILTDNEVDDLITRVPPHFGTLTLAPPSFLSFSTFVQMESRFHFEGGGILLDTIVEDAKTMEVPVRPLPHETIFVAGTIENQNLYAIATILSKFFPSLRFVKGLEGSISRQLLLQELHTLIWQKRTLPDF